MEEWEDQAVVLSARAHGEGGAVVQLLTSTRGRRAGYVYGVRSVAAAIEIGTLVEAKWRGSSAEQLGTLTLEVLRGHAALVAHDPWRLKALQAACALCEAALPERERQMGVFEGLVALLHILSDQEGADFWAAAYVFWEIGLLEALGFALDLERCAGGGDSGHLTHVSPKTGRAVSREMAVPYQDKLLVLPAFLTPQRGLPTTQDMVHGLKLTHYFLEHKVFAQHTQGLPPARQALQNWCKEEAA